MTGLCAASQLNLLAGCRGTGPLLSLALLALLLTTPNTKADTNLNYGRMEELERRIEETNAEMDRIRKDLKNFDAIVTLWDTIRKNFLDFTQRTDVTVMQCYESFKAARELEQKTGLKSAYGVQLSNCVIIIGGHEKKIQAYDDQIDQIRRDVEIVRALSENAGHAAETNQRNRELFEA
jgi:hypothetical protein